MSRCWDSELRSVPSFLGQLRKGKSFGWTLSTLDSVALAWKLLCFNGSLIVRLWTFRRENVYNFGPYFARRERICLQHESNCVSNAPCCHFEYLSKIIFKEFLSRLKQGVLLLKLSNSYNSFLHIVILIFASETKYLVTWVCGLVFCRLPGQIISIWRQFQTYSI